MLTLPKNEKSPVPEKDRPIVILDFDGVLNTFSYLKEQKSKGLDTLNPRNILDPTKVALLNAIVGVQWCLCTTWRLSHSIEELKDSLAINGFSHTVTLWTPYGANRADEIVRAIDSWAFKGKYAILDDDDDLGLNEKTKPFWVQVNRKVGLTLSDVVETKKKVQ